MLQYLRKVRVKAQGSKDGLEINAGGLNKHDLKIAFVITKGISSTANSATIDIYNLTESHRKSLGKEWDNITLEAGYTPPQGGDNVGVIFEGQMRDIEHIQQGADIISRLTAGEGDKAFRKAVISKSFKAGTPVKDVIEEVYKELEKEGVRRGEWKLPEKLNNFIRPYAAVGPAKREMDTLGRGFDFYWSVQNGVVEIIPSDGTIGQVVLLSPSTGLVGTPTITDNGVKAVALLNPEIRPNRKVKIESKTLEMNAKNGEYRVSEATYSGDNKDGEFNVYIVGESINASGKDGGSSDKKSDSVDEGIKPADAPSGGSPSQESGFKGNPAQDQATSGFRGDT